MTDQITDPDLIDAPPFPDLPQPGTREYDEFRADLERLEGVTDEMEIRP